ncbi:MAG: TetR/AcrR family transcriptional regulator [Candidatus Eremiobacteraeota bacterium]|nr:TetR/AcrR family transcriptional regulator [Candidatus Eremiobacteraeota bacterium]
MASRSSAIAAVALEREPRGTRRKRETRAKLLSAALRLMAERGAEGVTVSEITEAADVGFGSFYNHFESKDAIYRALVDTVFDEFADWLDAVLKDVNDPAEVVSASVRHTILRAKREPVWGLFLIREGFSPDAIDRGLGQRLIRDIKKGLAAERFADGDVFMYFVAVSGTVLASIAATSSIAHRFSTKDLPERCAATVLQTLGVERTEADEIARRPLPSSKRSYA